MNNINAATITKQLNARALAMRTTTVAKQPGLLQELLAHFLRWRRVRRDEAWLKQQPDYMLRDLGISRGEIETMVRRGHYR